MIESIRGGLEERVGVLAEAELVTDRRGVQVWRVTAGAGQRLAVKIATADSGGGRALGPRREVSVLRAIGQRTLSPRVPLVDGGVFTVTPWFDGSSTWEVFRAARGDRVPSAEERGRMLVAGVDFCRAVAELHEIGWSHGDLQAAHCVHAAAGPRLIDFANAQGESPLPEGELNTPFSGGLAHLEAPELAAGGGATPTPASDVYALGGSLWVAASGQWPLDYSAVGVDPQAASLSELRAVIAEGRVPLNRAGTAVPSLLGVLAPALDPHPDNRPTADELARSLGAL
ncbi:hypothetical protein [Kitasatospora aureofaciens]|uniref:hypothetical protein n=1 Tax=Kitasatospora aureofaciens TaxID=1894 RepID=UPI0037F3B9D7